MGGALDTRDNPEDVPLGVWRWKQNWRLRDGTKLCCREGFQRAFADAPNYTNQDFHDQGYSGNVSPTREYPSLLFTAVNNDGSRHLYLGTQNRIYILNEISGQWNLVLDTHGASTPGLAQQRWKATELLEVVAFTDNVHQPVWIPAGQLTPGTSTFADLVSLNITAASIVTQFAGFLIFMNVVEAGTRYSSRIWWSDYQAPLSFGPPPSGTTLSNFQDLDYGAQILNAIEIAGALYIFTTESIWRCVPTGDERVFSFSKVYTDPKNKAKCLAYPNTLVSSGTAIWYASQEAIYYFDPFVPEPVREEWLFRGGSVMYSDLSALNPLCCQSPVAGAVPEEKEIYISWPEISTDGQNLCVNSKTLIFNTEYKSVDIYDHGFSVFANYQPSTADTAQCKNSPMLFLGASVVDKSLKSIGWTFAREICTNADSGIGVSDGFVYTAFTPTYQTIGYYRILRALLPLTNFDRDKMIRHLLLEAHPKLQDVPCVMRLRIGNSFSEADPNLPDDKCTVLWHRLKDLPMKCLDTMPASQYVAKNIRRDFGFEWDFLYSGRFLYVEFVVANADGTPAIGGDMDLSRFEFDVQLQTS